ncbi:tRNA (guanine-N1)-methyltransferase [Ascidiimonas sp. W6]|uniref:tRNA (guanine-N1)-methyltransferase n=1 Tax=Ascidiimonas meishanensis TaxID=3128903 RepID=UPI0030EDFB2B
MKKKLFLLFSFGFFACISMNAQEDNQSELSLDKGSLENQFEYVIKKSGRYQEYKVVKRVWLDKLKRNVIDSLAKTKNTFIELENQIKSQQEQISKLDSDLASTNTSLTQVNKEKESISFFGTLVNKATYKTIMWSIVAALAIFLSLFIYKFKNSNSITREAKLSLKDLEQEYEQHRRKALEREQKLSRQLQDELNKQKLMKK